jgi:predicted ATPase
MFYDAFKQFGIRFILETHSEYLIRKTQAIVNRTNDLEAFKLYYIDNSKGIHEMRYREDGKFMDEFGPGFFDESANLAFELF